jgi:hypothetical protein
LTVFRYAHAAMDVRPQAFARGGTAP